MILLTVKKIIILRSNNVFGKINNIFPVIIFKVL